MKITFAQRTHGGGGGGALDYFPSGWGIERDEDLHRVFLTSAGGWENPFETAALLHGLVK